MEFRWSVAVIGWLLFLALAAPATADEQGLRGNCHCKVTLKEHRPPNASDKIDLTNVANLAQGQFDIPGWRKPQVWDWSASAAHLKGSCWWECRKAFGIDENGTNGPQSAEARSLKSRLLSEAKSVGQPMNWCGGWLSGRLEYAAGTNSYRNATSELVGLGSRLCSDTCKARARFQINGSSEPEVDVCSGQSLRLDGRTSTCYSGLFVSVQRSDPRWNRHGKEAMGWLPRSNWGTIGSFDIADFAERRGAPVQSGEYYRVKLAVSAPWHSESKLVHVLPPRAQFSIDGSSAAAFSLPGKSPLIMDGSSSECAKKFFVSIQESDPHWNRFGPEYQRWLTPTEARSISSFDLRAFLRGERGTFATGKHYRIKLATVEPWHEQVKLVYLETESLVPGEGVADPHSSPTYD